FGRALLILAFILVFSGLAWWMGVTVSRRTVAGLQGPPAAPVLPVVRPNARLLDLALVGFVGTMVVLILGGGLGLLNARRWIANDRLVPGIHAERVELGALLAALEEAQAS